MPKKMSKKDKDDLARLERFAIKDTTKQNRVLTGKTGSSDLESIFQATKRIENGKKKKDSLEF